MQDNVVVTNIGTDSGTITGTLNTLSTGALVDTWGSGAFLALKFTDIDPNTTSLKVGLNPSVGSGLVEIIDDPDKNGAFKITDKDTQTFRVVQEIHSSAGAIRSTRDYNLSGLTIVEP